MKDANTAAKTSHLRSDVTLVFYREQKGENLQLAYVDPKHSGRLVRSGLEPEKVNEILAEVAPLSTGSHDVLSRAAPSQEVAAVRTAYVDEKIGILLAQARERSDIHVTVHAGKSKSKLTKNLYASLTIVFSHTVDEKNVLLGSVTVIPTTDDSDRSIAEVTKVTIPIPTYLEAPAIEGAPAANTHESIPNPNLAPETLEALSLAIAAAEEKAAAKTDNKSGAKAIGPPDSTPQPAENPAAGTTEGSLGDLSEALEKGASSKKKKKKKKKRW